MAKSGERESERSCTRKDLGFMSGFERVYGEGGYHRFLGSSATTVMWCRLY